MGYHYHIAMKNFISTIIIGVYAAGLFIAAQLVWLDRNLKKRKIQFSPAIPPLMAVERHFFCFICDG